jgi:hypothetical protein
MVRGVTTHATNKRMHCTKSFFRGNWLDMIDRDLGQVWSEAPSTD